MGILRSDLIAHSQLTSANASVLFNGSDAGGGNTGLKTADVGNTYELMADIGGLTIECWINCTSTTTTFDTIWATNNYGVSGNGGILYQHNDGLYMSVSNMSDLSVTGLFETDTWYHVASVREWVADLSLYEWRLYVDGVMVGSATASNSVTEDVICIGSSNYGSGWPHWSFAGYISNFRMCRKALYRQNFTPSKFKLKNIPGTVLLCCQDASSATAVTVGDTLTSGGSPPVSAFGPDLKEDNTDTGVVFEDNTKFDTLSYMVPPGGTTTERGRGRGLRFGGDTPSKTNAVDYIQIQSGGIAQDFGDLLTTLTQAHGGSSSTRLVIFGGYNAPANVADIQYITMATTGNSVDSGINIGSDLTSYIHVASNETRAVYGGGTPITDTLEYVTIASLSSSTDFGDLTLGGMFKGAEMSSSTRGVFAGGYYPAQSLHIQYITIGTTGNSTDFGDLLAANSSPGGICSSPIRGIIWNNTNSIHYITIATTGDATEFGEASVDGFNAGATFSSHTRGCAAGGYNQPSPGSGSNASQGWIDSVEIASVGNAKDFGDLTTLISSTGGGSDCHGGLS